MCSLTSDKEKNYMEEIIEVTNSILKTSIRLSDMNQKAWEVRDCFKKRNAKETKRPLNEEDALVEDGYERLHSLMGNMSDLGYVTRNYREQVHMWLHGLISKKGQQKNRTGVQRKFSSLFFANKADTNLPEIPCMMGDKGYELLSALHIIQMNFDLVEIYAKRALETLAFEKQCAEEIKQQKQDVERSTNNLVETFIQNAQVSEDDKKYLTSAVKDCMAESLTAVVDEIFKNMGREEYIAKPTDNIIADGLDNLRKKVSEIFGENLPDNYHSDVEIAFGWLAKRTAANQKGLANRVAFYTYSIAKGTEWENSSDVDVKWSFYHAWRALEDKIQTSLDGEDYNIIEGVKGRRAGIKIRINEAYWLLVPALQDLGPVDSSLAWQPIRSLHDPKAQRIAERGDRGPSKKMFK